MTMVLCWLVDALLVCGSVCLNVGLSVGLYANVYFYLAAPVRGTTRGPLEIAERRRATY